MTRYHAGPFDRAAVLSGTVRYGTYLATSTLTYIQERGPCRNRTMASPNRSGTSGHAMLAAGYMVHKVVSIRVLESLPSTPDPWRSLPLFCEVPNWAEDELVPSPLIGEFR